MRARSFRVIVSMVTVAFMLSAVVYAQDMKPIRLPSPQESGGKPLMDALKERKSQREYSDKDLPPQMMSDMLWAACGINRPASGGRTAPTAKNMQEIDIYVAKKDGLYLYDTKANMLAPVLPGDLRAATGKQPFVGVAAVELVFVADLSKMRGMPADTMDFYAATDTGYVSQNVYLYCASTGLATVVRGWVDKPALAKAMKLRADQSIILAQTVGYPKEGL